MLFDDKDLRVFDSSESRDYFKEILQSYYSQNYRAAIVLLYSFVVYDLFNKLQDMASEGNKNASKKLKEINCIISNNERYSKAENEIIQFFKENCHLYFDKFVEDISYLKNCRNKCAHLKVNDNSLFVPSDYHVRMLICSMYDHIFSVKAPFIMDLFEITQNDIEKYTESISYIHDSKIDSLIKNSIKQKYLQRMTIDSLKKSYKTFAHLLLVSESSECLQNIYGLYAFTFAMTDYIIKVKPEFISIFKDASILNVFSQIKVDSLKNNKDRKDAFISLITHFPNMIDIIIDNTDLFNYISKIVLIEHCELKYYRLFFPRKPETTYGYFKNNSIYYKSRYSAYIYDAVKNCDDFNLTEYLKIMVQNIPTYNGFNTADSFMDFLIEHLEELNVTEIEDILEIYKKNDQCTNRSRHTSDIEKINKYIEKKTTENK